MKNKNPNCQDSLPPLMNFRVGSIGNPVGTPDYSRNFSNFWHYQQDFDDASGRSNVRVVIPQLFCSATPDGTSLDWDIFERWQENWISNKDGKTPESQAKRTGYTATFPCGGGDKGGGGGAMRHMQPWKMSRFPLRQHLF